MSTNHTARNDGDGPLNVNSSTGMQTNNTISGESGSQQYNNSVINNSTIYQPARSETLVNPASTILPRCDANFITRPDLLDKVRTHASVPGAWLALVGLGGVGKTQLVISYVQDLRERDEDIWILWIFASNADRFEESIRDVADQIRLPGRQDPQANVLQLLYTWLANSRRRWVIVLDNADDTDFLLEAPTTSDEARTTKRRIDYFPACKHGTVIFTSRSKVEAYNFVSESDVVEVLPMEIEHAKELLQKKLGPAYIEDGAARLAKALDYMPLALSQAASYILQKKRRYTIEKYIGDLEKSREARTSLLRQQGTVPKRDREASSSIIITWQISFEHVHTIRKSAADLLALMSFCDRQAIPEALLRGAYLPQARSEADERYDDIMFDDIQILEDFSFISTTTNDSTWEMHRLVQDATQWWLSDRHDAEAAQNRFVHCLQAVVPDGEYENWRTCQMMLPHIKSAMDLPWSSREMRLLWAAVAYRAAWYSMKVGSLVDADRFAKISLSIRSELFEKEDYEVLVSKGIVAEVHSLSGRLQEAAELDLEVTETRKRVLGEEHPDTLLSMNNLAATCWRQGQWEKAEELHVKVMEIRKRTFGEEHAYTLISINNLASTLCNRGRYQEAEDLHVRVLETRKRILGEEHPDTLLSMNNLASTLQDQHKWQQAEELCMKVVEIRKKMLGDEHPDTLTSMHNLATIFHDRGQIQQAQDLMTRCVQARTRVLGDAHPDTKISVSWLDGICRSSEQMKTQEAETVTE